MAVRFYLSNMAAPVTLTADTTGWEATSTNRVVRALSLTPGGSTASVSGTYTSPTSGTEMRLASFVSPPARRSFVLPSDADTGAFLITFAGARVSATPSTVVGYFRYWVVSGNGGTFRGTFGAAVNPSGWGTTTGTLALRIIPTGAIPVNVQVGDRIVIDTGFRVTNTTTSTGVVYYGGTGSNPDMEPADTGTTAQNRPAWVEWEALTFEDFSEPQRLYITNTTPTLTADHPAGIWDKTTDAVSRALAPASAGPPASVASIETSTSDEYDVLLGQWVSPPLVGSGSFTGGYRLVHGRQESSANANFQSRILLYVVEPDGTVRGVVHNGTTAGASAEWPTTATAEALFGGNTRVDYQDEDRVVVELGYLAENTVNTPYTGTTYYGGTDSPDLEAGDTDLDLPGWVNLPDWLVFGEEAPPVEGTLDATLPALTANLTGAVRTNGALGATLLVPTAALTGTAATSGALAGVLPLPAADLDGEAFVPGTLDGTLPLPTAALTGTTASTGTLGATLPLPTATLEGTTTATGVLDGQLPMPTAALGGESSAAGTLTGTLPVPTAELACTVSDTGALEASLPLPTAAIDGTTNTGTLSGTLPEPFANLSGGVRDTGELDATLPLPTAALGGDGSNTGTLTAALPMPAASLDGDVSNPCTLVASIPLPAADFAGTVTAEGALDAQLPLVTAALGGDGANAGSLDASLPMPSAGLSGGITVVAVIHGVLPMVTASLTGDVTASGTLAGSLPMPTAELAGTTGDQESRLDAVLPMPAAALAGAASATGVLAGVLPLPTANLSTAPPVVYESPLRAGQPIWGLDRIRAGQPVLVGLVWPPSDTPHTGYGVSPYGTSPYGE